MAKAVVKSTFPQETGFVYVVSYVAMFAVNAVVLYLANMFFPKSIVLGTHALPYFWAIGMSMGKLALIDTFAIPFVHEFENYRRKMFSTMEWMALYFVLNFAGIWVISRYSEQFGLGITSWVVAAALALVLDVVQGIVMVSIGKMMEK